MPKAEASGKVNRIPLRDGEDVSDGRAEEQERVPHGLLTLFTGADRSSEQTLILDATLSLATIFLAR